MPLCADIQVEPCRSNDRKAGQAPQPVATDRDDARRATNYRLRAVVKATGQRVFSELVADSHGIITLPNLAAGTELDITATAHNATRASPPPQSPPPCHEHA
jgi:hypothetical protein